MSGICGIFFKKNQSIDDSVLEMMLKKMDPGHCYFPSMTTKNTIGLGYLSRQKTIHEWNFNNLRNDLYVCDINLHNQAALKQQLGIAFEEQANKLISVGYDKWDIALPKQLKGDFTFAIYDQQKNTVFAARDRIGIKPLYYVDSADFFAWASAIPPLLTLPGVGNSMDEEWLLDLLSNNVSEKDRTHLTDIKRLKPGHWIKVDASNTHLEKYWDLTLMYHPKMSDEEAISHFKHLLSESVSNCISVCRRLGCELSGGLDSSSIAVLASKTATRANIPFSTYSHVNPDYSYFPFKDERQQISEVNQFINNQNIHLIDATGRGIFDALEFGLNVQGGPTQQRFYEFSDGLYAKAAENDVDTLLSGFGGDEMVTSHAAGYYHELATSNYHQFLKELIASHKSWKGKLNNLMLLTVYAKIPGVYHWWTGISGKERKRLRYVLEQSAIQKELVSRYNLIDRSLRKSRFPNQASVAERQYARVMHPHVSQRLEYSVQAARFYGIEYRYPLLDADLLQFYYSLPARLKYKNHVPRFVMREAMKGLLPESIRLRQDKSGATIPSVHYRYRKDYDRILHFLEECRNKKLARDIIDYDKMVTWAKDIYKRTLESPPVYQGMFFNYLMLLMFLDNQ